MQITEQWIGRNLVPRVRRGEVLEMGRRHTVETLLAPERMPSAHHTLGRDLQEEMKSRKKEGLACVSGF